MNLALLSKLGWRLVTEVEPLLIKVLKAKHLVAKGIGYLVSTGRKASFCLDSWLKEKPLHSLHCHVTKNIAAEHLEKLASDYWRSNGWNLDNLSQFLPAIAWNKLWKLRAPPKSKTLLWLIAHERVLTNSAGVSRGLARSDDRPRCNTGPETVLHLVRDCPTSEAVWRR
ncbi:hypothetical protein SLEP1_g46711 [Rubroshorea leprosula]|uniref:Reverse transcriptase zinc-binding domain-containing protein n=1 Tax=Rubroshorea leprosula TaxID=152421 RepID=A0AAV5LNV0_9ROSI|nr:hypothetical protein SLEP1_g46711 [Rubroshorea leprosula]